MPGLGSFFSRLIFGREPSPTERLREIAADRKRQSPVEPARREEPAAIPELQGTGEFGREVVGESHYQRSLEAICGRRTEEGEDRRLAALLVPEDSNPHDANAVRVEICGKTVGYLNRGDAIEYRKSLTKQLGRVQTATCTANIRGGWDRGNGDRGHYGVWLDV